MVQQVQRHVSGIVPHRYVEVDAARLLLVLSKFAQEIDDETRFLTCFPERSVVAHFTPEYLLQKLDFLLRYPKYLAYELIELHHQGISSAKDRDQVIEAVKSIYGEEEMVPRTQHFRKFWRGAYERIDRVEAWWHSRELVYTDCERRGSYGPKKHFFLTQKGLDEASRLPEEVSDARWYADRISLIHCYFGELKASQIKELQYQHLPYRQAQLDEMIPDLTQEEIERIYFQVFREPLEKTLEREHTSC
jgi:hypothetical protein